MRVDVLVYERVGDGTSETARDKEWARWFRLDVF